MTVSKQIIEAQLAAFQDPYLKQDWGSAKVIKKLEISGNSIEIEIALGYPVASLKEELILKVKEHLAAVSNGSTLQISIISKIESHVGQRGLKAIPNIKNIIPVASGKGGVGKSTVAVNLALALAKEGARVGILDADIYGPSQPLMLGAVNPPEIQENKEKKVLLPIVRHGVQSMSIGYLVDPSAAMIWRGPLVSTALQQLLNDTQWDDLDYLIIDLPPGTGDIQLTLAQKIPVTGAVVVTTPQDLALLDVRRAYEMFRKVNIPVLGVVENMGIHTCVNCGHKEAIFGEHGGKDFAAEFGLELLGRLPLDRRICEWTDAGNPPVVADPLGDIAMAYREIARQVAAKIALQTKNYGNLFSNVVVKNG